MFSRYMSENNVKGFLRYFKNMSWIMAEQFLRIVSGVFIGIWVARYLGPEQFGIFSYVLAFSSIFAAVAKFGLDGIVVRELVEKNIKYDLILGTAFWIKVVGALTIIGLIGIFLLFSDNESQISIYILIISVGVIFQSFEVVEFHFQSQVRAKVISICKLVQLLLSSVLKVYLISENADLIWFVIVVTFDVLTLSISYFIAYKTCKYHYFYSSFNFVVGKKLLKDSWPLIFSSILILVYMRTDQLMIKELLGEYELGIYSAAVKLSESVYFIPILISNTIFPAIINSKKYNQDLYIKRLQYLYTFIVWLAIIIAVPVTFFSEEIIILLYGNDYIDSSNVLIIHIWSAVFVFLGVCFGKYLLAENLTSISLRKTILGAVCNILLNLYAIPRYGIEGAAAATILSQFVANVGYDIFDKRLHKQLRMKRKALFFL